MATPTNPITNSDLLEEHRSLVDGYDDDDIARVLDILTAAYGITFVCVWNFQDWLGFGGDSNIYAVVDGEHHAASDALWEFLTGEAEQPPATVEETYHPAVESMPAFEAHSGNNYAIKVER